MSREYWAGTQYAFSQAAGWDAATTRAAGGRWDAPGLGEWTMRDLVGHTSRALVTVETYLDAPARALEVSSPADYLRLVLASPAGDPAAVAQRGRKAGAALGVDPAEAVEEITARVLARVDAAKDDVVVATPVGGMRLGDYLPTRTFELTVHTCDLAAALGQPLDVPPAAAVNSLTLLGELAARAGPLLLAGTGRGGLPDRFTAL